MPAPLAREVEKIAQSGSTQLVVADGAQLLGVIHLKDMVKPGIARPLRRAAQHGHPDRDGDRRQPPDGGGDRGGSWRDDYLSEARPEDKLRDPFTDQAAGQAGGHDRRRHQRCRPRWLRPTSAVAMNSGTQAASEAANMVDLESTRPSCIEVVQGASRC